LALKASNAIGVLNDVNYKTEAHVACALTKSP